MDEFTNPTTVESQHAVSVNLCPDCGKPPELFVCTDGLADCRCSSPDCRVYDVSLSPSWQTAIVKWNQNTAKAYAERSESPISTPSDSEHADVENRPQDGLECDTREKVLADLERLAHEWHDYDGNFMRIYNHVAYAQVKELLDRQDAITRAECDKPGWEYCETCEALSDLTAERDDLRSRLETQANSFAKLERENAKLRDKLKRVREMLGG